MRRDPETLLTAWADDPRALSPEERAEVERLLDGDAAHRREAEDTRALLGRLRDLGPEGREPAWGSFERELGERLDAARPGAIARWLTRWWKPALGVGLAATAAVVLLAIRHAPTPTPAPAETAAVHPRVDAGVPAPLPTVPPAPVAPPRRAAAPDTPFALGALGEVPADDLDDDVVDEVAAMLGTDPGLGDDDLPGDDELAPADGLVPDLSLDWVDDLDDDQIDRVDAWIATAGGHAG